MRKESTMQLDFHYYAAYCASIIAGYTHEESLAIAYSDQFVDCCSKTLLTKLKGPKSAATTQLTLEMANASDDILTKQDITRIWASFHFLPRDLYARVGRGNKNYKNKFRLICGPNGALLKETVNLVCGKSLQAVGMAMHILSDTWAHSYFAGTPSLVINNTNYYFYEILPDGSEREISFKHNPGEPDDPEKGIYINSLYQPYENSVMNLGHGRCGHLPDYSYAVYKYLPAWGDYDEIVKNNMEDYYKAFCQMVYALKTLKDGKNTFEVDNYDYDAVKPYEDTIKAILSKRQLIASDDWKAFGEKLSGREIEDFDVEKYQDEYLNSKDKDSTFLGAFFVAALAQKSMVTANIFKSGNILAGLSVDYSSDGKFRGIKDFKVLADYISNFNERDNDEPVSEDKKDT